MAKGTIRIYVIFSIVFFVCLAGWFTLRVTSIRSENIRAAEQSYKIIQGELSVLHKLGLGIDAQTLRDRFDDLNRRRPPLKALTIYSENTGAYFIKAERADLYSKGSLDSFEGMKGPSYSVGPAAFLLLRSPLPFALERQDTIQVDALYEVLGPSDIYPPLQLTLILLAAFLILTGILIAIARGKNTAEPAAIPGPPAAKTETVKPRPAPEPVTAAAPVGSNLYSPKTGLVWQTFLNERLNNELKRAASFDQDLVLGIITVNKQPAEVTPGMLGALILEHFPFSDLAFEYGDDGCAVIIPNTDLDQGISNFESLLSAVDKLCGNGSSAVTAVGLSSRNGRLLQAKRLITEADKALHKAACEEKSTIIAFRTDPSKYRDYIASRV